MITGIELFSGLSPAEQDTVTLFTQERLIKAGEILFHEGDDASAMYIVKSGNLKAFKDRSIGEQILGYISVGEMVGEMALFDANAPKKRLASVRAVEDTLLLVIVDYAIVDLGRKHPVIHAKIFEVIRSRSQSNKLKSV